MTDLLAYHFVKRILFEQFPSAYWHLLNQKALHYELTNILELCAPLVSGLDENDRFLKGEIISTLAIYLQDR